MTSTRLGTVESRTERASYLRPWSSHRNGRFVPLDDRCSDGSTDRSGSKAVLKNDPISTKSGSELGGRPDPRLAPAAIKVGFVVRFHLPHKHETGAAYIRSPNGNGSSPS